MKEYTEGKMAWLSGKSIYENPYKPFTDEHIRWFNGYKAMES